MSAWCLAPTLLFKITHIWFGKMEFLSQSRFIQLCYFQLNQLSLQCVNTFWRSNMCWTLIDLHCLPCILFMDFFGQNVGIWILLQNGCKIQPLQTSVTWSPIRLHCLSCLLFMEDSSDFGQNVEIWILQQHNLIVSFSLILAKAGYSKHKYRFLTFCPHTKDHPHHTILSVCYFHLAPTASTTESHGLQSYI